MITRTKGSWRLGRRRSYERITFVEGNTMRFATLVPTTGAPLTAVPRAGMRAPSGEEAMLIERMQASNTLEHIDVLNRTPRTWKSAGYDQAVDYVVAQMRDAGWDVRVEELETRTWAGTNKLRNVIAERRGTAPDGVRGVVVAGAHLDSVRNGPGANDNASGSSTLIELARSLDGIDTRNDVRLVWFDGEEAGLLGSIAHVKANAADTARTIAMLNMDMVGSAHGRVGYDLGRRTGTQALSDALKGVQLRTGLSAVEYPERHSRSDHASFDAAGIPVVDFGVAVKSVEQDDPYYHSPRDTVDKINRDVLEGYGDLIAVTLLEFANRAGR